MTSKKKPKPKPKRIQSPYKWNKRWCHQTVLAVFGIKVPKDLERKGLYGEST